MCNRKIDSNLEISCNIMSDNIYKAMLLNQYNRMTEKKLYREQAIHVLIYLFISALFPIKGLCLRRKSLCVGKEG